MRRSQMMASARRLGRRRWLFTDEHPRIYDSVFRTTVLRFVTRTTVDFRFSEQRVKRDSKRNSRKHTRRANKGKHRNTHNHASGFRKR